MNDFVSNSMEPVPTGSISAETVARPLPLALHFAMHAATLVVAWSLLAAADSWTIVSGLGIAKLLAIITGTLAGGLFVAAMHEWGHLLGARMGKADITISSNPGIVLYQWHFPYNSVTQFMTMSLCGTAGGLLGLILLFIQLPPDTAGRTAVLASAAGFSAFAAVLEWPVIWRTRSSREAGKEYAKITSTVLALSATAGFVVGALTFIALG
ncbi:MAG: hypothetical protein ABJ013_02115 [Halioglobus sp.]